MLKALKTTATISLIALSALAFLSGQAIGQERYERDRDRAREGVKVPAREQPLHLDQRYQHDHYYPPRGFVTRVLPTGSMRVLFRGSPYFFHAGVWWRPQGGSYVVIAPPPGLFIPALPPAYVTLSIGGAPYYYANGVYYGAVPGQGYTVVAPPPGAEAVQPVAAPPPYPPGTPPATVIYPRNGQSPAQAEADREQCRQWAGAQPGAATDPGLFERARGACMDGRGYTMR